MEVGNGELVQEGPEVAGGPSLMQGRPWGEVVGGKSVAEQRFWRWEDQGALTVVP